MQSELAARRDRRIAAPVVGRGGRMVRDAGTAAPIHGRGVGADAFGKGRRAGSSRILLRFPARSFSRSEPAAARRNIPRSGQPHSGASRIRLIYIDCPLKFVSRVRFEWGGAYLSLELLV